MTTLPPEVLDLVRALITGLLSALLDNGRIDADEANDLRDDVLEGLHELGAGVSLADAAKWVAARVRNALERDPARMRLRAAELAAEGQTPRAGRLLRRAERVERRQGDGDAS
jgi:hypothetical protein